MRKIKKILTIIFIIVIAVIVLIMLYPIFEPKLLFLHPRKDIVLEPTIINDLQECSNKYYDAIFYNKKYVLNDMTTIFNRKNQKKIDKIHEKYKMDSYYLIVKKAYSLYNNTYICDIEIIPKLINNKYDWNNLKKAEFTIRLNKEKGTFKVYDDKFNLD